MAAYSLRAHDPQLMEREWAEACTRAFAKRSPLAEGRELDEPVRILHPKANTKRRLGIPEH